MITRLFAPALLVGAAEAVANTPQEAAVFLKAEIAKWATVAKQANIKAE